MDTFQEKLKRESSKIIQWQVKRDVQYKEMERKLLELEELVERQRKNLLQQQMNCEEVSQEYANEVKHQEELEEKVQHTHKICGILQEYFQNMLTTFASFEKTRVNLISRNDSIKDNYEQLIEKFNVLRSRHMKESNYYKKMLDNEKEQHIKNENQWQLVCKAFEQKLQEAGNKILHLCYEKDEKEKQLKDSKTELQQLSEAKEHTTNELAGELIKFKELLNKLVNEKSSLISEIDSLKKIFDDYSKLKKEFEDSSLKAKQLETDLSSTVAQIPIAENLCTEKELLLENATKETKKLLHDVCATSAEVNQVQCQVEELCRMKQKLEHDLSDSRDILNQKLTEIKLLQNNSETEMSKLSELLKTKEIEINSMKLQLEEYGGLENRIHAQIHELAARVSEFGKKNEQLLTGISAGLEKCNTLKEVSNQLEQVTGNLNCSIQSVNKDTAEKTTVKINLEAKIKEVEQAVKNREMECSTNIKNMLSSMEEYKQSYISRLSDFEEEKKKLSEKITSLEKDNRELAMERKIWEEKVIYHENLVTKSESRKQILENHLLQLKAEFENEKSKAAATNLTPDPDDNISDSKELDSDSPQKIIRQQMSGTQKRVTFDSWSDSTEDSVLDMTPYQVGDNVKKSENLKSEDSKMTVTTSQPSHFRDIKSWERTTMAKNIKTADKKRQMTSPYTTFSQPLQSAGTKFFRRGQKSATKFHQTGQQNVFTDLQDE